MARFWPWLAAILSGVLLTLCFPRWDQAWLCWIALTPLISALWFGKPWEPRAQKGRWAALLRHPLTRPALLGYVSGLVFFWGTFSWLITVTGPGWFILAFYLALYPAVWALALAILKENAGDFTRSGANLRLALTGAATWTALEWVRGWLFSGFGWNGLGVALHGNLAFLQIAEYTGVGGLSFLVALTNLIAVITVRRFLSEIRVRRVRPHWDFSLNMALIVLVFLFGVRTIYRPPACWMTRLRVAAVQASVPQMEKWDPAFEKKIFERYTLLTETALAWSPQLLIWPEAATPRGMFADQTNFTFVHDFAAREDFNFLLGSIDSDGMEGGHDYNIAALLNDRGAMIQTYRKMHLVPFGEYIPFRRSFPLFAWIVGDVVPCDFTPGQRPTVLKLSHPAVNAAALICFEDTVGELTRRFVEGDAQLLINLTNDGWFQKSAGSAQHLANAVFRTVENRRPMVRAANTGVTAFISPLGRVTAQFEDPFGEGVLTGVVPVPPPHTRPTFYTQYGEFFSQSCAALSAALLALALRKRSLS